MHKLTTGRRAAGFYRYVAFGDFSNKENEGWKDWPILHLVNMKFKFSYADDANVDQGFEAIEVEYYDEIADPDAGDFYVSLEDTLRLLRGENIDGENETTEGERKEEKREEEEREKEDERKAPADPYLKRSLADLISDLHKKRMVWRMDITEFQVLSPNFRSILFHAMDQHPIITFEVDGMFEFTREVTKSAMSNGEVRKTFFDSPGLLSTFKLPYVAPSEAVRFSYSRELWATREKFTDNIIFTNPLATMDIKTSTPAPFNMSPFYAGLMTQDAREKVFQALVDGNVDEVEAFKEMRLYQKIAYFESTIEGDAKKGVVFNRLNHLRETANPGAE
jgi:hypothetical protein